jgi:hypothetical protein
MGWTWEVIVLENQGQGLKEYQDYAGESLWQAIQFMRRARKRGVKYVVLAWRP